MLRNKFKNERSVHWKLYRWDDTDERNGSYKWKMLCAHELEELTLLKSPYYPKWSTNLWNTYQNSKAIFKDIEETISKFVLNHKRPQLVKEILRKKDKAEDIILSDLKLYYKAAIIKYVIGIKTKKQTHRWLEQNRGPRINP